MRPKLDIQRAIVLREAGLTLSSIAERTGLSASTLYRAFKANRIERGDLTTESIEEARQQLLNDAGFVEELKHTIAASIVDDLALVRKVREALALMTDDITNDSTTSATLKARSLAAISTSLKITQEVNRKALNMDDFLKNQGNENLPELIVVPYTEEEVAQIKKQMSDGDDDPVFESEV